MKNEISFEHFNKFKESINYGTPQKIPTIYFHDIDFLVYHIKDEITNNIIIFNKDNRIAYLKKILKDLKMYERFISVTIEDVNKWLKKYDTSLNKNWFFQDKENELHFFLNSHPPTYDEEQKEDYNVDKGNIQRVFCSYFSIISIRKLIDFTEDQFEITEPSKPKLKTNLSVPELAVLFRELNKLKPCIFEFKKNTELYRFIANNFTTKKQDNISYDSLGNEFVKKNNKVADFWIENMYTIIDNLKKSKEN